MANELVVLSPKSLAEARDLATMLSQARTIPEALQKSPADVMAIVMAGAELGLAPMQAIRALVLIKGKPTLSADAMGALVKSRGDICEFLMLRHSDGARATYETKRRGDPASTTMSFTIEEAKQAGLNGDNWRKFTAAMLRARALSAICRAVYPDLLLGVYDPDEIQAERDVTPRHVPSTGITPQTEAESIAALSASIEATKKARPRLMEVPPDDYGPDGAPLSERARLSVALEEAQDEASLLALVERIAKLQAADKATLRARWGVRRDEVRAKPPLAIDAAVESPEPGSEG